MTARDPEDAVSRHERSCAVTDRAYSCLDARCAIFENNYMKHWLWISLILTIAASSQAASEHHGQVRMGAVPIPGAVVRATQGGKVLRAISDAEGNYSFADLPDGNWTIQVEMLGFAPIRQDVVVNSGATPPVWELKLQPFGEIKAGASPGFPAALPVLRLSPSRPASAKSSEPVKTAAIEDFSDRAADGLLINGTVNNGASTPFALPAALGNNRRAGRPLYTGTMSFVGSNALFDARSFSLTGQNTPQPAYNRLQSGITFGGPLQIPHVFRKGSFTVSYNRTQNRNVSIQTAQMPTAAERAGNFSASARTLVDPVSGLPFAGNVIAADRISPQAKALVRFYPLPNLNGGGRYNYQIPIAGVTHGDNLSISINNIALNNSNRFTGGVALQSSRTDSPDLFGFVDRTHTSGANGNVSWVHRMTQRVSATIRYQFNRTVTKSIPFFSNQQNISGDAGISGNDPDPRNWGPPSLNFSGGIARLSDGTYSFNRSQSNAFSYSSSWSYKRHGFTYGADLKRQQFNLLSQQDARGSFTFTGAASGIDFADFLLSIPTASSIAFGNPDKYFRQTIYDAFVTDDWRVKAALTLNLGVRWEYEAPITERYGRLVNLNIAPGFLTAVPVIAGTRHESLVRPDRSGFEPRIGLAWRPRPSSSMIVRAGYGVYRDTAVYRAIADNMAQQSPLSKSLSVQNSPANPLTLAEGFLGSPSITATTFAVDPHFRVGNAQNWNLSIQQDLPAAMQMTVTYLGIKGTHVPQRMLPNTFPLGAVNPCPSCPSGFVYLTSGGNSNRNAGTIEVRRRQRNGFQASVAYTFAKAIDDAGLGGNSIAQNWLDLRGERALSNFDQRHQVTLQAQYTTGMLVRVGSFWDGWRGKALKEWTLTTQLTAGSGSPLTPVILAPVNGTGMTGSLRPNVTGAPLYINSSGAYLNPLAFETPAAGQWGNAGRNSITGPGQFGLNAGVARTFHVGEKVTMDLRVDATNVMNHVTFPRWNTMVNNSQFGLPINANAMRSVQPSIRVRF